MDVAAETKLPMPWILNRDPGLVVAMPTNPVFVAKSTDEVAVKLDSINGVYSVDVAAEIKLPTPWMEKVVPGVEVPMPLLAEVEVAVNEGKVIVE